MIKPWFVLSSSYWIGRFLAELTKQVFSDLAASKYQVLPSCPLHFHLNVSFLAYLMLYVFG